MPAQGVIKTIRPARNGHPAHPACLHQTIQVAVDSAQAQARALRGRLIKDLFGGGVVAKLLYGAQHQLPLFGITHLPLSFSSLYTFSSPLIRAQYAREACSFLFSPKM